LAESASALFAGPLVLAGQEFLAAFVGTSVIAATLRGDALEIDVTTPSRHGRASRGSWRKRPVDPGT